MKNDFCEEYEKAFPKAVECLEEGFEGLITSYLLEYSEDWQTERCYINASSIKVQKEILFNAA